ncbi:MAG: copper homeostasis protein CutC [Bacteroidota bacterium]
MNAPFSFEVCIDSVESALSAEAGGAHRVELCDNLYEGGTTPSFGMIRQVKKHCSLPVMAMIRPRGGDFLYSDYEFEVMRENVVQAKEAGADGLVMGLLNPDGSIDKVRSAELRKLSGDSPVTFHRAFDMVEDWEEALEAIIGAGFDMILTSGLEANVMKGKERIKKIVEKAGNRIKIMAGAGVRAASVGELISHTGVQHIHASASHSLTSHMQYRNPRLSMGAEGYDEYSRKSVSQEKVVQILQAANKAWKSGNF